MAREMFIRFGSTRVDGSGQWPAPGLPTTAPAATCLGRRNRPELEFGFLFWLLSAGGNFSAARRITRRTSSVIRHIKAQAVRFFSVTPPREPRCVEPRHPINKLEVSTYFVFCSEKGASTPFVDMLSVIQGPPVGEETERVGSQT